MCHQLVQLLRSNSVIDEKTTTEQNFEGAYHPDDQAVSQDEEMELTTGLSVSQSAS